MDITPLEKFLDKVGFFFNSSIVFLLVIVTAMVLLNKTLFGTLFTVLLHMKIKSKFLISAR